MKKKWYESVSLIVWVTIALTAGLMVIQKFLPEANIPHEAIAVALIALASGYVGTDRIAGFVKTKSMDYGSSDVGDVVKMRAIVYGLLILVMIGLTLQIFYKVPNLAVITLITAYGGAAATFAIGNKAIKAATFMEPKATHKEEAPPKEEVKENV